MNDASASILAGGPDTAARPAPCAREAGRSRFVIRLLLISAASQALAALQLAFGVKSGLVLAEDAARLSLAMAAGVLAFYGWVQVARDRLPSDDALFSVQAAYAILCSCGGYAILGPMRACALLMVSLILAFTMFARSVRVQRRVVVWMLAAFAFTMAFQAHVDPARYPPRVEAMHFLGLATVGYAIVVLGAELSRLRRRAREQRADLEVALQRIQLLASRDELTGLMNRRCMQDVMTHTHQRFLRLGHGFCVALVDLDHFKQVNDRHGHAAGDAVLRAFAQESTATVRGSDILARWGGEEFLLLMSDTPRDRAARAVERLRERVEHLRVPTEGRLLQVTFSAGVVEHLAGESLAETIERADRALYAAKSEGRNRVASR